MMGAVIELSHILGAGLRRFGLAAMLVSSNLSAAEIDITGEWRHLLMEVPEELYFSGTRLIGGNNFFIANERWDYRATAGVGTYADLANPGERGLLEIRDNFEVRHLSLSGSFRTYLNQSRDIMIGAFQGEDFPGIEMMLRSPASFTIADLAGQWDYRYIEMPQRVAAPNLAEFSPLTGARDFNVEMTSVPYTVAANGRVSHPDEGVVGTLSIVQGLPTLISDGPGEPWLINAGLDLMVNFEADTTEDGDAPIYSISILTRRPETVAIADVVGRWHVAELYLPSWLQVGGSGNNRFVQGGDEFGVEQFPITIFPNGRLVADDDGSENAWSLTPEGFLRVEADAGPILLALNRSKNFAASVIEGTDDTLTLTLAVKYSNDVGAVQPPQLSLTPIEGRWQLVWSGGTLESATSLAGPWLPVAGASSPRPLNPEGERAFFRVRGG